MDVFNAANKAISFTEQLPDLTQKLREALTSKFTTANPLYAQRESAQQEFLNAPSRARADISQMQQTSGVPLSPTQQEAITSGRRSAAFAPLSSANLTLGSAFGGLEGIIGGGVKAFEAAAGAQTERANLLNQLRQQEVERQFKEKQLALDYAKLKKGTGAGGLSLSNLLAIANYKKPTAQQTKDAIAANSGIDALTTISNILNKNPNVLTLRKTPIVNFFNQDVRQYNAAGKEAYDAIQRTRTGAALNLDEQKFYRSYIPSFGDSEATINQKIARLSNIYDKVIVEGTEMDLGTLLQSSGIDVPGLSSDWE